MALVGKLPIVNPYNNPSMGYYYDDDDKPKESEADISAKQELKNNDKLLP